MKTSTHTISVRSNRVDHLERQVGRLETYIGALVFLFLVLAMASSHGHQRQSDLINTQGHHVRELFERLGSVRHAADVADAKADHCNTQADDVWRMVRHHHRGQP